MFLRVFVAVFWTFTLLQTALAQTGRRKPGLPPQTASGIETGEQTTENEPGSSRRSETRGWVWVSRTIDLAEQLGGEDNIMTLDGEPLPAMRKPSVTLGLVIDDEGHVVTRLVGATPANPPIDLSVRAQGGRPTPAKFLGMDAVTGLCVLQVEGASFTAPPFSNMISLPKQLRIKLFGFHPKINQNTSVISSLYPRCNSYPGQIVKAVDDFRFNNRNPIYHLLAPQMTLAQDCSLILDENDSVFGVAVFNIGGSNAHIVYPISRLQTIARSVIESQASIAYGWIGATGQDAPRLPAPRVSGPRAQTEMGVQILNIAPDSPAEKAGVKPQDVVVAVNDRRISTYTQMVSMMKQISPDNEVSLKVRRGREYLSLKARLASAPAIEPELQLAAFKHKLNDIETELSSLPPTDPSRPLLERQKDAWRKFVNGLLDSQAPPDVRLRVLYGFEVQQLTSQLLSYFAAPNGLLVSSVNSASAKGSGLQTGDVIVEANSKPITKPSELIIALDSASGSGIEIVVERRHERVIIKFKP